VFSGCLGYVKLAILVRFDVHQNRVEPRVNSIFCNQKIRVQPAQLDFLFQVYKIELSWLNLDLQPKYRVEIQLNLQKLEFRRLNLDLFWEFFLDALPLFSNGWKTLALNLIRSPQTYIRMDRG